MILYRTQPPGRPLQGEGASQIREACGRRPGLLPVTAQETAQETAVLSICPSLPSLPSVDSGHRSIHLELPYCILSINLSVNMPSSNAGGERRDSSSPLPLPLNCFAFLQLEGVFARHPTTQVTETAEMALTDI